MKRAALVVFIAAATLFAVAAPPSGPAVAFVADLHGSATIEGNGPVSFLAELPAGTRLLLGTGATMAVTFAASGTEFTLVGPGEFTLSAADVRADRGADPARRAVQALADPGVVARAARNATAMASIRMRGVRPPAYSSAEILEFPVNTSIATLQPNLRWKGIPKPPHGYSVVVTDASGRDVFKGVAVTPIRPTSKLAPDTAYTWTLADEGVTVGSAKFRTLPAAAIARADATRPVKSFRDLVIRALVLEDVGATQEANEAWAQVARERPDLAAGLAQRP